MFNMVNIDHDVTVVTGELPCTQPFLSININEMETVVKENHNLKTSRFVNKYLTEILQRIKG